ncbi:hypothetical protein [Botrimarina sp.]|uniref:hypothetical protein n=1 Tax=Botrimarina sp. TaxID=2795802 RepID=UPI0032EE6616
MAKCDEGYLCQVCGRDVGAITDSDLYLRYVIGEVDPEVLHTAAERHLRCNPALAQYIVDERFEPVGCEGDFDKRRLDAGYVARREELVTRGWRRLRELPKRGGPITEYPLPEVVERLGRQ